MNASLRGSFKGVSTLSYFCLSRNVDDLLDEVTGLVGLSLLPESDESSNDVSKESSEDEDSYEIIIILCAIQTCSSSPFASL